MFSIASVKLDEPFPSIPPELLSFPETTLISPVLGSIVTPDIGFGCSSSLFFVPNNSATLLNFPNSCDPFIASFESVVISPFDKFVNLTVFGFPDLPFVNDNTLSPTSANFTTLLLSFNVKSLNSGLDLNPITILSSFTTDLILAPVYILLLYFLSIPYYL